MQKSDGDRGEVLCLSLQFAMKLEDESWLPIAVLKADLISGLKYKTSWAGVACLDCVYFWFMAVFCSVC